MVRIGGIIDSIARDAFLPLPNDVEVVRLILSPDPNHHRLLWGFAVDKARIAGCMTPTKKMIKEAIKTAEDYLGNNFYLRSNVNLIPGGATDLQAEQRAFTVDRNPIILGNVQHSFTSFTGQSSSTQVFNQPIGVDGDQNLIIAPQNTTNNFPLQPPLIVNNTNSFKYQPNQVRDKFMLTKQCTS
jgi:hypothetical protein